MYSLDELKSLPKIEVSFQDDFCGCETEQTTTPRYVLKELQKLGINPQIGDRLLLWEKDVDADMKEYFLCNIGKIMERSEKENVDNNYCQIDNKAVVIHIDKDKYFDLPQNSSVFGN